MAEPQNAPTEHRHRLLEGMARAVAVKGYADTTIADVVREAAVSRRTFYEHFSTKADCLVALYEAASHNALKVLRQSIDPGRDWQDQVERVMQAYLACLAQNPVLLRTLFIEILGLGPTGLAVRRRMNGELAAFILQVINGDGRARLTPALAMMIVGAVNELVLEAIEQDRVSELTRLAAPTAALVRSVVGQ